MPDRLLYPENVAIIGASRNPSKVGHAIVAKLIEGGFEGEIIPVNPYADEILGLKCYKSLTEYDKKIDLGMIAVPAETVIDAIGDAIRAKVRALCIVTAGFKESGPDGAALQDKISAMCKNAGIRLLGPNVIGIINTHHKLNATFGTRMPYRDGISVISQSGAICTSILDWAYGHKLGLANVISIGNKGDLDEVDFIDVLSQDEKTKVIVGYLEDIQNGDAFIKAARKAAAVKPIVILKAGISKAGAKAASSHTGSMAGADIAYGAAFSRSGIIRAESIHQLLDFGMAFSMQPLPLGDNVAIVTNAGGPGIVATDAIVKVGLNINPLSDELTLKLREKLPPSARISNPINIRMDASSEMYVEALNAAQDDPSIHAVICICAPQAVTSPKVLAKAIIENAKGVKPVLAVFMGDYEIRESRDDLILNRIPTYDSPSRAADTLRAMRDYKRWLEIPPRIVTRFPVNRRRVERIIARHMKVGTSRIGEYEAKEILKAYDFNVPEGSVARNVTEAVEAAELIGYPVAMKIISPDIIHKSDIGGVKLNIGDSKEVEDSFDFMMIRAKRNAPDAQVEGVYIEKMCHRGRELILGMSRDPQFGPVLMFGLGGIFVEAMEDVTFYLAPITAFEAMQMLKATRSYALLQGARGEPAVDLESVAEALQRISQLVTDFPEIKELDINPFIVGAIGTKSFVADASMILEYDPINNG